MVKRKLVEIIGTESWNEEPDTPPGDLVTGTERTFSHSLPGNKSVSLDFVGIGPGVFQMGSDNGYLNERPVHEVEISRGFWLGKYEVTQGEWESVMGSNPSYFTGNARRPVDFVSWYDVHEFIGRLNDAAGDSLYRLPTEAEWEYACRAGTTTRWSLGDDDGNDESLLDKYAWYDCNDGCDTKAVGGKLPNAWGLYDMHGNVWEWVQDWFGNSYYNSPSLDPSGPDFGSNRVTRGGGFYYDAQSQRSANRGGAPPGAIGANLGVRLVRLYNP